jgi:hypothetical protein
LNSVLRGDLKKDKKRVLAAGAARGGPGWADGRSRQVQF